MGVAAFELLLEEMICCKDEKVFISRTIELETSIIERDSSLKKNLMQFQIKKCLTILQGILYNS